MGTRFMTCLVLGVSITLLLLTAYCHCRCIDTLERDLRVTDSANVLPIYRLDAGELPEGQTYAIHDGFAIPIGGLRVRGYIDTPT